MRKIIGAAKLAQAICSRYAGATRRGPVQVGVNRRELRDGRMTLGQDFSKVVAPYVDVLRLMRRTASRSRSCSPTRHMR